MNVAHQEVTRLMRSLIVRGQEIGVVRKDLPLETIERLMHAIGKVLCADIVGEDAVAAPPGDDEARFRMEKFMDMVHDLGKRILTPEEVQHA
jgi:hypothetical protein